MDLESAAEREVSVHNHARHVASLQLGCGCAANIGFKRDVDRSQSTKSRILTSLPSKSYFGEVPMAGLEPAQANSAQRILSPLRLPFRHIGAAACILSFFQDRRKWISQ